MDNIKTIEYYKSLPYNFIIQHMNDESGSYYYGRVLELDGCQSNGDTFDEAYASLQEAFEGYIETKLENGVDIPEPVLADNFSGKFVIRLPKSLHCKLSMEAQKEGVSLNQYALYKLSK